MKEQTLCTGWRRLRPICKLGRAGWIWTFALKASSASSQFDGILSIHPKYPNTEVDKIAEASDTEFYLSPANAWNYACENCLKDIWRSVAGNKPRKAASPSIPRWRWKWSNEWPVMPCMFVSVGLPCIGLRPDLGHRSCCAQTWRGALQDLQMVDMFQGFFKKNQQAQLVAFLMPKP